jgi:adenylate cyclase
MPVEIERKFLVAADGWRAIAGPGVPIAQGYLCVAGPFAARVRRMGDAGFLTMKSNDSGVQRLEFEYSIPAADADAMLSQLGPEGLRLEKTRFMLQHEGHEWSVDVFGGALWGLVLAEIELSAPDERFATPDWLGAEVTDDLRYRNAALAEHGLP